MEPETELDAVLIDEFDAEIAPAHALRVDDACVRRKPPVFGSLRGLRSGEAPRDAFATRDNRGSSSSVLRHYPSFDAIPVPAPGRHEAAVVTNRSTSYPRFESLGLPVTEPKVVDNSIPDPYPHAPDDSPFHTVAGDSVNEPPRIVAIEPTVEQDKQRAVVSPSDTQNEVQDQVASPPVPPLEAMPTDEEIEYQRRQIEAELRHFQQQADYVALALAGNTPHQKEMRRLRELERQEREERRLAAVETRLEHMVERELQREARQEQRRLRHAERTHRSSVSPSPERDGDGDGASDENVNDEVAGANLHGIEPK